MKSSNVTTAVRIIRNTGPPSHFFASDHKGEHQPKSEQAQHKKHGQPDGQIHIVLPPNLLQKMRRHFMRIAFAGAPGTDSQSRCSGGVNLSSSGPGPPIRTVVVRFRTGSARCPDIARPGSCRWCAAQVSTGSLAMILGFRTRRVTKHLIAPAIRSHDERGPETPLSHVSRCRQSKVHRQQTCQRSGKRGSIR
jgi:hypothetical protein